MRYVWKIHYEDGTSRDDAIAFTEMGATLLDKKLREKHYRVDPKPIRVPISELTIIELEYCLKIIGDTVAVWDKSDPGGVDVEANILRELGCDIFVEHDKRLGRIREDTIRYKR